ncbi:MAG: OmpW family outer membrane protein [Pedobacter sp.]|nr:OmpW family outer membrane protein [Pedobacter sp.]
MKTARSTWLAPVFALASAGMTLPALAAEEPDPWDPKPPVVEDELYRHKFSLGYLMLRPQSVGHGLDVSIPTAILPSAKNFTAENVETRVGDSNTIGLFYSYAIDEHWGIEVFGGVPPEIELYGNGVINAPVTVLNLPALPIIGQLPLLGGQLQAGGLTELLDAGDPANNPIATGKAWSPTVITTYTLFDKNALIRPYIGLGLTYGFLTDIEINPNITKGLNEKGALIALLTGNPDAQKVTVEGEAEPFFSAVGTLGVDINLTEKLGLKASATYVPSSTEVKLLIKDSKGKQIGEATTDIPIDPLIFFVAVSYRFNL